MQLQKSLHTKGLLQSYVIPKIQQIRRNVIDPLDGSVSLMEAECLVCPRCDGFLSHKNGRTETKHCPECGQAIDWSEEE